MANRVVEKTGMIAQGELLFTSEDLVIEKVDPKMPHNFVNIISQNGDGDAVIPTAGHYYIYVETHTGGGFSAIMDNGKMNALKTGGSAATDGNILTASFDGPAFRLKVVPDGVVGATHFHVQVFQYSG